MRAKVDDFAYVLVAAVIIIAVLLAIFALIPPGGIGVTTSIENFTLGAVGFTGDNMQSLSFGNFRVGDPGALQERCLKRDLHPPHRPPVHKGDKQP
ncbi:MAG: hypothetical protein NTY20_06155 [Candidatus Aenigmarchaeota archaeon]|nr:hypothetical protein [Candidatus Aenigmarchaeota archaeon]